jgi:hypothetical protein
MLNFKSTTSKLSISNIVGLCGSDGIMEVGAELYA